MDFRYQSEQGSFGVRVSALMMQDGRIYLAKSPQGDYYLLGGAILVNEATVDAVKREIFEEVGIEVEVEALAFIVENHFKLDHINYHQIEFHYVVSPLTEPQKELEEGGQRLRCEWVALENLEKIDLKPAFLKSAIPNWDGRIKHFVNKDGEN